MIMALLIAGIVFLLAGLLGIVLGIPVKEFSFGNTEILAGVIVACTGTIMVSLWVSIRELKQLARRTGAAVAAPAPRSPFALPSALTEPSPYQTAVEDDEDFLAAGADAAESAPPSVPSPPPSPPPWHEQTAGRDRRGEAPAAEPAPAVKPRRNLMFSSSSRKERERSEGRAVEFEAVADPRLDEVAAPPPLAEPADAAPASFEDAWPQPERMRMPDTTSRRTGRMAAAVTETSAAAAGQVPPPVRQQASSQITVLKSGVVDGMAYSLYSDGSIEAQMPEGMMRFASIDELRTHLDQRG